MLCVLHSRARTPSRNALQRFRFQQPNTFKQKNAPRNFSSSSKVNIPETPKGNSNGLGILFFSSICLTTLGLGVWQTKRYFWKLDMIADAAERYNRDAGAGGEPIPSTTLMSSYSSLANHVKSLKGQKVVLRGEFDHSREILVGPRAAAPGLLGPAAQGMATNPLGYFIYTPFKLSEGGHTVFVNRGWVPKALIDGKNTGNIERPEGEIELRQVIVINGEVRNRFTPDNNAQSIRTRKLLWAEPKALEEASGIQATAHVVETNSKPASASRSETESNSSASTWWFWTATQNESSEEAEARLQAEKRKKEEKEINQIVAEVLDETVHVEAILVEVIDGADSTAFPIPRRFKQLTEIGVTPETHMAYAITWYSLTAAGMFMTHRLFRGKSKILQNMSKRNV